MGQMKSAHKKPFVIKRVRNYNFGSHDRHEIKQEYDNVELIYLAQERAQWKILENISCPK
jgi:hypothetical protein